MVWTGIDGLKEVFDNQEEKYQKVLDPVSTEYLQVKYVVEKLHYVVSIICHSINLLNSCEY